MGVAVGGIAVIVIYLVFLGIIGLLYAVVIADYIMGSIALQRIATRKGLDKPWLVWIPVVRDMVFGALLDVDDAKKGVQRNWKKILLILSIASAGLMALAYVCFMGMYVVMIASATVDVEEMMMVAIVPICLYYILIALGAMVAGALNACRILSVFKIFEQTVPEKLVKYFLIYLMVPLGGSLCLLKCRELGDLEPEPVEENEEF